MQPVESSSKDFVGATDQWRSEDRRYKSERSSAIGQRLLIAFVQFYRVFLSQFFGGACKFYPSCSRYAQEAIALHGAKRGSVLALKRLGRCRPFMKGGFDPVPESELGIDPAVVSNRHDFSRAEWLRTANKELVK